MGPLPLATLFPWAELYTHIRACILAKNKTDIYTYSIYTFGVIHGFGFLTSSSDKIKNGPYIQELLDILASCIGYHQGSWAF